MTDKFEGTLDLRRHPVDPEHYGTLAKATAEALADEIARRRRHEIGTNAVYFTARDVLLEWFTGKFTPGSKS